MHTFFAAALRHVGDSMPRLRNGVFCSIPELTKAIKECIAAHDKNPKPFVSTATAQDILAKVIRANARLSSKQIGAPH